MLLERAEFLGLVHAASPPAVVGLRLAELYPPDLEEQVKRGRAGLAQRGVFRPGEAVLAEPWDRMASALTHPSVTVAHMRNTPGSPTRKTVYYAREVFVRHDYTLDGVHRLALLAEEPSVVASLVSSILDDAELIDGPLAVDGVSIRADAFEAFGQAMGRDEPGRAVEMLCGAGFNRPAAQALTDVWRRPVPRSEIAFFRMVGTEIVAARQLVIVQGARSVWSILEEPAGSDVLQVATTSRAATSRLLAGYLNEIRNARA
jgi:hypothetical protein